MPTNHMAGQSTARYMSTRVRDTGHTLLYSARLACITCMSATQRTSGICSAGLGTESRCCLAIHRLWGLFTQPLHRYEMRIALQKEGLGVVGGGGGGVGVMVHPAYTTRYTSQMGNGNTAFRGAAQCMNHCGVDLPDNTFHPRLAERKDLGVAAQTYVCHRTLQTGLK